MAWDIATGENKHIKLFIYGPAGCWKTRVMLRLGNVPEDKEPILAVMDTEFGTDHYAKEFRFRRKQKTNCIDIVNDIKDIIKTPGNIKALGVDSYTIFDKSLVSKWVDLYLKRLLTSSGHKSEFYVLQPNDHQNINKERDAFIRMLLESNLNVFVTAEVKNEWEGLKVVGKTFDAPERFEHFFDTVIEIRERKGKPGYTARVHKDRSYRLKKNAEYDWDSEQQAYELLKVFDLTQTFENIIRDEPIDTTAVDVPDFAKEAATKAANAAESNNDLLWTISNLKKELRIPTDNWGALLKPFSVTTATALNEIQLVELKHKLEAMRPTPAAQAA